MQKSRLKLYIIHESTAVLNQWFAQQQITTKSQANKAINNRLDSNFVSQNQQKIQHVTQDLS